MANGAFVSDLEAELFRTFIFPETVFTAVTAYQNQLVSKPTEPLTPRFFLFSAMLLTPAYSHNIREVQI